MSKVVYKIDLPKPGDSIHVYFRTSFKPLHVGLQNDIARLWFEVDPTEKDGEPVELICIGTGWTVDTPDIQYMGTIIDGAFTWHYYFRYFNE